MSGCKACNFASQREEVFLAGAGMIPFNLPALRARGIAFRRDWDACPAWGKGGLLGAAPANLMPNTALRVWAAIVGNAAGRKGTDVIR